MSGHNEIILCEGERWGKISEKLQARFDPLPLDFMQEADRLHTYMVQHGFFRMNRDEDKGLRFVGSFQRTFCGQSFHFWVLPKYLPDSAESLNAMPLVMSAISKTNHLYDYVDEAIFQEARVNSSEKKIDLYRLATWIVQDYSSNGVFFIKEKRNSTQKKGRINWPRTILKKTPFLDGDDVFYDKPIYTSINRNDQLLLSEIHKCAVQEALDYLKAFHRNTYTVPPDCDTTMLGKLGQFVSVIRKFQRVVFSNRDINLLRALEAWCHRQSRYYELPVGTVSFHSVWEDALRNVFGNIPKSFTFGTPEYRLGLEGKFQLDNDSIPDIIHIFKSKNDIRFLLLDAKYYLGKISTPKNPKVSLKDGYQWIEQFPGYKDIAKQIDYRYSLESRYGLSNGVNAFVLPWYDIKDLPLAPSPEGAPPWVRYLGYATKGELDKDHDDVYRLLNQLRQTDSSEIQNSDSEQTDSSETSNSSSEQKVLIIQVKPEWLYQKLSAMQDASLSPELWDFLIQYEKAQDS